MPSPRILRVALAAVIGSAGTASPALASAADGPGDGAHWSTLASGERDDARRFTLYAAAWRPADRSGWVSGYQFQPGRSDLDRQPLWGGRTTASIMDAHGDAWPQARTVLSARDGIGIDWRWPALSQRQQQALATDAGDAGDADDPAAGGASTGQARLAYLRGERRNERGAGPGAPFRRRGSRHGDIVNSKPWHQPGRPIAVQSLENHAGFRRARATRPAMLYVGANDGMLHGFDAASGEERLAYVPEGLHARLAELTRPDRPHTAFVDGSPLAGDLYLGATGSAEPGLWRSYLAGFLGRGGRGWFVLDITDPETFGAAAAARLVVLDRSGDAAADDDIGEITAEPVMEPGQPSVSRQIARLNDGRWALLTGNGERSPNGSAALLIQYLDGDRRLHKIVAEADGGNGLAAPRLVDLDGNGTPDLAYAGDLRGNLWKFDLAADSAQEWKPAFEGRPLFTATDSTGRRQPIASAPVFKAHPDGGLMIAFGTGARPAGEGAGPIQHSLYGIHDDAPRPATAVAPPPPAQGPVAGGRRALQGQTLRLDAERGAGTFSSARVPYTGAGARRGWFLDLPLARERVLHNPGWFDGDLIDVWSVVPAAGPPADGDLALPIESRHRNILDIFHGTAPRTRLYPHLPAGLDGSHPSRVPAGPSLALEDASRQTPVTAPGLQAAPPLQRLPDVLLRPAWRQLR